MLVAALILQVQGPMAPGDPLTSDGAPLPAAEPSDFRVFWNDGFRMETTDGSVKARFGGRIHYDYAYVGNNQAIEQAVGAPLEDGTMFRRARAYWSGVLFNHIDFKAQYDFAPGTVAFRDVYVGLLDAPWGGNVRVGQYKEPWSLEEQTSSNYITFMERSLANTFSSVYSTGLMWYNDILDQRATAAVGVFRNSNEQGAQFSDSEWSVTGRVTGVPLYDEEDHTLLHVGLSANMRSGENNLITYGSRPESRIAPTFVSVTVPAEDATQVAFEAAFAWERLKVQGEYVMSMVDATTGPDPDFMGYYVQGSFFLTGDYHPYDRSYGVFGRVKPASFLYGPDGGCGAWEAKLRYSAVDLTDSGYSGGELADITGGLNWYLNNNTRIMLEVVHADLDGVDSTQIVQTRFQVDF
ncbi:MAG: hypothetical protein EYC70_05710 [Planctomycetota bacterium]|nr:MAG: hypothetical protein EYC70_05710 [Planctomycetota bacterium]